MKYDPKTKTYTGDLHVFTDEEMSRSDKLVKDGRMVDHRHPSDEELAIVNRYMSKRDVEKEVMDARDAARKAGRL